MWVYTEFGEHVGNLHGVYRPAGEQAMLGNEPVDGHTAQEWEKRGFIEWKEDPKEDDVRD